MKTDKGDVKQRSGSAAPVEASARRGVKRVVPALLSATALMVPGAVQATSVDDLVVAARGASTPSVIASQADWQAAAADPIYQQQQSWAEVTWGRVTWARAADNKY